MNPKLGGCIEIWTGGVNLELDLVRSGEVQRPRQRVENGRPRARSDLLSMDEIMYHFETVLQGSRSIPLFLRWFGPGRR